MSGDRKGNLKEIKKVQVNCDFLPWGALVLRSLIWSAKQTQCWMLCHTHVSGRHYSMQRVESPITGVEAVRPTWNDTKNSATENLFELSKAAMVVSTGQNPKAISGASHIQGVNCTGNTDVSQSYGSAKYKCKRRNKKGAYKEMSDHP